MLADVRHFHSEQLEQFKRAVFSNERIEKVLTEERENGGASMTDRVKLIEGTVEYLCNHAGRQWVRDRAALWWRNGGFSEEEGDKLVETLLVHEVFGVDDFELWGPTDTVVAS